MLIKMPRVPKCHLSTRDHKVPKCLSVQVPRVHECPSTFRQPECLKCSSAQVPKCAFSARKP